MNIIFICSVLVLCVFSTHCAVVKTLEKNEQSKNVQNPQNTNPRNIEDADELCEEALTLHDVNVDMPLADQKSNKQKRCPRVGAAQNSPKLQAAQYQDYDTILGQTHQNIMANNANATLNYRIRMCELCRNQNSCDNIEKCYPCRVPCLKIPKVEKPPPVLQSRFMNEERMNGDSKLSTTVHHLATLTDGPIKRLILKMIGISDINDIDRLMIFGTTKSNEPPKLPNQLLKAPKLSENVQRALTDGIKNKNGQNMDPNDIKTALNKVSNMNEIPESPEQNQNLKEIPTFITDSERFGNIPKSNDIFGENIKPNPDVIEGPIDPNLVGRKKENDDDEIDDYNNNDPMESNEMPPDEEEDEKSRTIHGHGTGKKFKKFKKMGQQYYSPNPYYYRDNEENVGEPQETKGGQLEDMATHKKKRPHGGHHGHHFLTMENLENEGTDKTSTDPAIVSTERTEQNLGIEQKNEDNSPNENNEPQDENKETSRTHHKLLKKKKGQFNAQPYYQPNYFRENEENVGEPQEDTDGQIEDVATHKKKRPHGGHHGHHFLTMENVENEGTDETSTDPTLVSTERTEQNLGTEQKNEDDSQNEKIEPQDENNEISRTHHKFLKKKKGQFNAQPYYQPNYFRENEENVGEPQETKDGQIEDVATHKKKRPHGGHHGHHFLNRNNFEDEEQVGDKLEETPEVQTKHMDDEKNKKIMGDSQVIVEPEGSKQNDTNVEEQNTNTGDEHLTSTSTMKPMSLLEKIKPKIEANREKAIQQLQQLKNRLSQSLEKIHDHNNELSNNAKKMAEDSLKMVQNKPSDNNEKPLDIGQKVLKTVEKNSPESQQNAGLRQGSEIFDNVKKMMDNFKKLPEQKNSNILGAKNNQKDKIIDDNQPENLQSSNVETATDWTSNGDKKTEDSERKNDAEQIDDIVAHKKKRPHGGHHGHHFLTMENLENEGTDQTSTDPAIVSTEKPEQNLGIEQKNEGNSQNENNEPHNESKETSRTHHKLLKKKKGQFNAQPYYQPNYFRENDENVGEPQENTDGQIEDVATHKKKRPHGGHHGHHFLTMENVENEGTDQTSTDPTVVSTERTEQNLGTEQKNEDDSQNENIEPQDENNEKSRTHHKLLKKKKGQFNAQPYYQPNYFRENDENVGEPQETDNGQIEDVATHKKKRPHGGHHGHRFLNRNNFEDEEQVGDRMEDIPEKQTKDIDDRKNKHMVGDSQVIVEPEGLDDSNENFNEQNTNHIDTDLPASSTKKPISLQDKIEENREKAIQQLEEIKSRLSHTLDKDNKDQTNHNDNLKMPTNDENLKKATPIVAPDDTNDNIEPQTNLHKFISHATHPETANKIFENIKHVPRFLLDRAQDGLNILENNSKNPQNNMAQKPNKENEINNNIVGDPNGFPLLPLPQNNILTPESAILTTKKPIFMFTPAPIISTTKKPIFDAKIPDLKLRMHDILENIKNKQLQLKQEIEMAKSKQDLERKLKNLNLGNQEQINPDPIEKIGMTEMATNPTVPDLKSRSNTMPEIKINYIKVTSTEKIPINNFEDNHLGESSPQLEDTTSPISTSMEFTPHLGKIVQGSSKPNDVFFMGNGIKLPLKMEKSEDGTLNLQVDLDRLCGCKNSTTCLKQHANISETVGAILEKEAELKEQIHAASREVEDDGDQPLGQKAPNMSQRGAQTSSEEFFGKNYKNDKKNKLTPKDFGIYKPRTRKYVIIKRDAKNYLPMLDMTTRYDPRNIFNYEKQREVDKFLTKTAVPLLNQLEKTSENINNRIKYRAKSFLDQINKNEIKTLEDTKKAVNKLTLESMIPKMFSRNSFDDEKFDNIAKVSGLYKFQNVEQDLENKLEQIEDNVKSFEEKNEKLLDEGYKKIFKPEEKFVKEEVDIISKFINWLKSLTSTSENVS